MSAAGSQTTASTVSFGAANTAGTGNVTVANAYGTLMCDITITAGTVAK